MKVATHLAYILAIAILIILLTHTCGRRTETKVEVIENHHTETVDSLKRVLKGVIESTPKVVTRYIYNPKTKELNPTKQSHSPINERILDDTLEIPITIQSDTLKTKDFTAIVEDSVAGEILKRKFTYTLTHLEITKTIKDSIVIKVVPPKKRWSINLGAGISYNPFIQKAEPSIGIMVGYKLLSF
jgi:hypothetical protein